MKDKVTGFLEVMTLINSLFDLGCDVDLDSEVRAFAIVGYDYSDILVEEQVEGKHPLTSATIQRMYECDPYVENDEGDYDLEPQIILDLIDQIKKDNDRAKESLN